jgi:hypothetical protein
VTNPSSDLTRGSLLLNVAALGIILYAIVFFIVNFTDGFLELGIGPEQVDVSRADIETFSPSLFHYIGHIHVALAGFIAATGVAMLFLVNYGVKRGEIWAWRGAVVTPVLGLLVALPAHYPNGFDTLLHLGPVYLVTVVLVIGATLAWRGINSLASARRDEGNI